MKILSFLILMIVSLNVNAATYAASLKANVGFVNRMNALTDAGLRRPSIRAGLLQAIAHLPADSAPDPIHWGLNATLNLAATGLFAIGGGIGAGLTRSFVDLSSSGAIDSQHMAVAGLTGAALGTALITISRIGLYLKNDQSRKSLKIRYDMAVETWRKLDQRSEDLANLKTNVNILTKDPEAENATDVDELSRIWLKGIKKNLTEALGEDEANAAIENFLKTNFYIELGKIFNGVKY